MRDIREYIEELQKLDTSNVGSWPLWVYGGAIILASLLILGLGTWYMVTPKHEQLQEVRAEEPKLRKEFENKQKKVANLDAYREQLAEMERTFGNLLRQLPSKTEVPSLLNDISRTRVASGLEEELFKPRGEVKREFYAVLPNDLVVIGSYHDLGRFVSGVASLPRIVTLDNIEITPVDNNPEKLRMTVVANTYRYLEEGGR